MASEFPVGVAWYREDQWNRLRALATDRDKLANTYAEWLVTRVLCTAQTSSLNIVLCEQVWI